MDCMQQARPPCPSLSPGVCSDSYPTSEWCHPTNLLIPCHPLLLLPSIFPSIRVLSNKSALQIRWPKYWSFGFSFSPSDEYSGLISFRMDCLDILIVQGTLKSLSSTTVQKHQLFGAQLSLWSKPHNAAAAKLSQLCPTLCDPIDGTHQAPLSLGFSGILEWVAISLFNAWKWKVKVKLLSCVQLFMTPWTVAYQALPPMSTGFSRHGYWSGLPLPSPQPSYP